MANKVALSKFLSSIIDSIASEWLSRISKRSKAKFSRTHYYKSCMAHLATSGWRTRQADRHITHNEMITTLYDIQEDLEIDPLLSLREITGIMDEAQTIFRESEPYQIPWILGHALLSDIRIPEGEVISPLVAEAFGKLCVDMQDAVYDYSYENAFFSCDDKEYEQRKEKDQEPETNSPPVTESSKQFKDFNHYWSTREWSGFEERIKKKHTLGTTVQVHSYYVTTTQKLKEFIASSENEKEVYISIVKYLLEHRDIIIDLEFFEIMKALDLSHNELFSSLQKLTLAGVIGAKVRQYFMGPATMYAITGELVPRVKKIRRRVTPAIRRELLKRSGNRCQIMNCSFCGNEKLPAKELHIDHLIAFDTCKRNRIEPDANPENLRVLCAGINRWKSSKPTMDLEFHKPLPPPLLTSKEWEEIKLDRKRRKPSG